VILTDQGASGGFGCLLNLRHFYTKGYVHILSNSFLIWLHSFNKLLIKPSKKKFQKILLRYKKMQTFMLSSNMKIEHQKTFHKKVTSKRKGNNQAF